MTDAEGAAPYAALEARLALADLAWRTGRRDEAASEYARLAELVPTEPVRRAGPAASHSPWRGKFPEQA